MKAALMYAAQGHVVDLFEGQQEVLDAASRVNQARLHTGLHYPRDARTARMAADTYDRFIAEFRDGVREIKQIYAVASHDSKTSADQFVSFADDLGIKYQEVDPTAYFNSGCVDVALEVREGSFDIDQIRRQLKIKCAEYQQINLTLMMPVISLEEAADSIALTTADGRRSTYDIAVVCSYAHNRVFADQLGAEWPSTTYQLCEVILGDSNLNKVGITVMDGPFWSSMPFGWTEQYSLTHVRYTPLEGVTDSFLNCQVQHGRCGTQSTYKCDECRFRPASNAQKMLDDFQAFTSTEYWFEARQSIYTLKAVPHDPQTDARPTTIMYSRGGRAALVFSGKVGDILNLHGLPGL
jgi:hypothetical protein